MKNLLTAVFALLLPVLASAQFSISGKITDQQTGETLPGATISLTGTHTSVAADVSGIYQINGLQAGNYTIKVSYIGYQVVTKNIVLNSNQSFDFKLSKSNLLTEEVTVTATRASANSPIAFTNLNKNDIAPDNTGRGFEYLLDQTPSAVVSSNAGAGVGYTSVRIRGSDATRINVTLNGIPLNDAEDQGVYFVDLPDLASSVDNIQVQRGVGTSTNGAGAFGASINIQTTTRRDTGYVELNNSAGSYGTIKNTVALGTGLLDGHFSADARFSDINSDGYIDRAFSHLKSFFLTGAYYGKNSVLRLNVFSGYERTYQAWNGVPQDSVLAGNRRYNQLGSENVNGTAPFYGNQTDNYTQNYYQLLYDQKLSDKLSFSGALHFTKGYGYYEEYVINDSLKNYGLKPVTVGGTTISATDLTRQLWLSNNFYGATYSFNYHPQKNATFILGGAYNEYDGDHYNNIQWTAQSAGITPGYQYSENTAQKNDFNIFARAEYHLGKFLLYGDMQYRHIYYSFLGFDEFLNNVQQQVNLNFFNPKAGITYQLTDRSNVYASFSVGNHEPDRNDYTQSTPTSRPKPETLDDWEIGYRTHSSIFSGGINGFYMHYDNQLVLTGALNDVGAAIRSNVKDSYREGIEADGKLIITKQLSWGLNAAISSNKVYNFQQYLTDYDNGETVLYKQYAKTDIAYSPSFVGGSTISYHPTSHAEIAFISKYVGRQYLDNTSDVSRSLDAYFVNDIRLNYNFSIKGVKNIGIGLLINNIFSEKYQSDGATYPDIEGGKVVNYNYFFTQAPINFLASLNLKF
ncbi:TonB-dependent receptor [Mucilaginibacter sp. X4EP1]|uniref:TonB-dependent receptor n=1 Tax=Mucilaginibacter sp. X4EP1 TaxID=2723092 RepID=UPI0021696713|nr:TonB-dependent receptor [Mucilaginibacter sp. X4EP1]MCS3811846.1 iron complex outermembrane receptor protein [Mucilaginibacter sp. X4EP1]